MLSIALKNLGLALSLSIFALLAHAGNKPPKVLNDPLFNLRYQLRNQKFERLDPVILNRCTTIAANESFVPVFFIYGRVVDTEGRIFYASGGYAMRINPEPSETKYEVGGYGLVFRMDGETCLEIGTVEETFSARYFEETPQAVLEALASDMAKRYVDAFGSAGNLRDAFKRRGVKPLSGAVELNRAFKPYYSP